MAQLTGANQVFHSDSLSVDSSPIVDVGTRGWDTNGNEFVYLRGTASVVARDWVVYDENFTTTRLTANEVGPVAVAPTAITTDLYGWFQIYGTVQGNTDTISADAALYIDGTDGRVDDLGVAGDLVIGAYSMTASAANVATCFISHPHVSNDLGGASGGTPGGVDTNVQFNDGSSFGGDGGFTFNKTTDTVTATAFISDSTRTATATITSGLNVSGASGSATIRAHQLTADRVFNLPDSAGTAVVSADSVSASAVIVSNGTDWRVRTPAQARVDLGLAIGTDVQAFDAQLSDIAGLTPTASTFIEGDGTNFVSRTATNVRGDLGLVIGTNVQAWDNDLDDLAALSHSASATIISNGTDWVARTPAQARADLGLAIGTDVQAFDAQLADVAGLSPSASAVIIGNGSNFVVQSGAALRSSIGLGTTNTPQFLRVGVGTAAASTASVEVAGSIVSELFSMAEGTVAIVSWATANVGSITLNSGGTTTVTWATASLVSGQVFVLSVKQPSDSAGLAVVWPGTVAWPSGTAPTISSGTAKTDVFAFLRHGADNKEYGQTVGQAY